MLVELEIKLGDSGTGIRDGWLDGQVVHWQLPGTWLSPIDFMNWFLTFQNPGGPGSGDPPGFSSWSLADQETHARRVQELAFLTSATTTASTAALIRYGLRPTQANIDDTQREIDLAAEHVDWFATHGYDLRWGRQDLAHFGILRADLTAEQLLDLEYRPIDTTRHPYAEREPRARRAFRIPYEDLVSASTRSDWLDRSLVVPVDRAAAAIGGNILQRIEDRPPPPLLEQGR